MGQNNSRRARHVIRAQEVKDRPNIDVEATNTESNDVGHGLDFPPDTCGLSRRTQRHIHTRTRIFASAKSSGETGGSSAECLTRRNYSEQRRKSARFRANAARAIAIHRDLFTARSIIRGNENSGPSQGGRPVVVVFNFPLKPFRGNSEDRYTTIGPQADFTPSSFRRWMD